MALYCNKINRLTLVLSLAFSVAACGPLSKTVPKSVGGGSGDESSSSSSVVADLQISNHASAEDLDVSVGFYSVISSGSRQSQFSRALSNIHFDELPASRKMSVEDSELIHSLSTSNSITLMDLPFTSLNEDSAFRVLVAVDLPADQLATISSNVVITIGYVAADEQAHKKLILSARTKDGGDSTAASVLLGRVQKLVLIEN